MQAAWDPGPIGTGAVLELRYNCVAQAATAVERKYMRGHPDLRGQGLVEYAFILVLVVIVVMLVLVILGPSVGNMFSNIVDNI